MPTVAASLVGESHRVRQVHECEFGRVDHGGDLGDVAVGDSEGQEGKRGFPGEMVSGWPTTPCWTSATPRG